MHFNIAEKKIKDENEECSQLPNECDPCDSRDSAQSKGSDTAPGSSRNGNVEDTPCGPEIIHSAVNDKCKCGVCGVGIEFPYRLRKRMHIRLGEKPYKCSICDKKCLTNCELRTDNMRRTGLPRQRRVCVGRYVSLSKHMLVAHSADNIRHLCFVCNKAFRHTGHLKEHMLKHTGERPYTCADCGSRLRTCGDLKRHMVLSHTKEKNHICTVCGKAFALADHLRVHMRIHSGEKPYYCETCGRAYRTWGILAQHRLVHRPEKAFLCITCGKQYRTHVLLWRHKMIHSGEQRYECSVCGMKFNQSFSKKRHMLVHTGEKPYSCSDCGKRFTQSGTLACHRRRHCPKIKDH